MKRTKKITTISVSATIDLDSLFLEEEEAIALIKAVDSAQVSVEFTEKVVIDLINDLKREFETSSEFEDFKQDILKALEFK